MVLSLEEKEKALHIYKSRQQYNQKYLEKLRGDKERHNSKGRPLNETPSDEQLEQVYNSHKEAALKKCKQRNPQTKDEIIAVIKKLTRKLEQLETEAMKAEDKQ